MCSLQGPALILTSRGTGHSVSAQGGQGSSKALGGGESQAPGHAGAAARLVARLAGGGTREASPERVVGPVASSELPTPRQEGRS